MMGSNEDRKVKGYNEYYRTFYITYGMSVNSDKEYGSLRAAVGIRKLANP